MSPDSVETKIIGAAVECIEEFGLEGATNRRIAEKAGVNLAAINYYFRSKDKLMERVMETTLHNAFDWDDVAKLPGNSAKEKCIEIFIDIIKGGCNYPGITRAHFHDLITKGDYNSLIVAKYSEFMHNLVDDMYSRGVDMSKDQLSLACSQIACACFMAVLFPQLNQESYGLDLSDEKTRRQFVSVLVDKLL